MKYDPETRPSLLLRLRDPTDERAWTEFLEIYEPLVYRLVRRKGLQDADAREVTQQVLIAVAGAIGRWKIGAEYGSFRGWLFRIARNLVINYLMAQRRQTQPAGGTDMHRLLEAQPAPGDLESSHFDQEYKRQVFRWAAEQIRGEFRESTWLAFWQTCVDGRSIAEVAAELQLSTGSVYIARCRVIARLREKIEQHQKD